MTENVLHLRPFGRPEQVIDLREESGETSGHGGGDAGLMKSFCRLISGRDPQGPIQGLTSVDASVESHVMALAAEASRLAGGATIALADF